MNQNIVESLYEKMLLVPNGVKKTKIDLHIHTPASKDFNRSTLSEEEAYLNILDGAIKAGIEILAITDHNTFCGANYIKNLIKKGEYQEKYKKLIILCGIEITCFSKHLLAYFPESFDENKQKRFLNEIGIDSNTEGSEEALADTLGPSSLIDNIGKNGGFAILAHADGKKGFLKELCESKASSGEMGFTGKSLSKIIKNHNLLGIQYKNYTNKKIIEEKFKNQDYLRENKLAFIKCSDCHGVTIENNYTGKSGKAIGEEYSIIKLSELSFNALKMALIDSEMRVCEELTDVSYPYIEGIAIKSMIFGTGDDYRTFHFSPELNCIIGSRGTGKTTILEIIQSIVAPDMLKGNDLNRALERYDEAVVFLNYGENIYAFCGKSVKQNDKYLEEIKRSQTTKIYIRKKETKKFVAEKTNEDTYFLQSFLMAGYQQRKLFEYSKDSNSLLNIVDDFINWKNNQKSKITLMQIEQQKDALNNKLKDIFEKRKSVDKEFTQYLDDEERTDELIRALKIINTKTKQLTSFREKMVSELNGVLTGKVKLSLKTTIQYVNTPKNISHAIRIKSKKPYEYFVLLDKQFLRKIYGCSLYDEEFRFYILLLDKKYDEIRNNYKIPNSIKDEDFENTRRYIKEEDIMTFLQDGLEMKYNINSGTSFKDNFKDNKHISMGQNAVAILLMILSAAYNMDDNRPLLMDQPEDDLDNSYIYSTLVSEFRRSKTQRQVIISTHNPNIPVSADAENIVVLKYNGEYSIVDNAGAIDSTTTAKSVMEIMEGGKDAIKRRIGKYSVKF